MDSKKRKRLEGKGWRVGGPEEFLGLSAEESLFVEVKLALATALGDSRRRQSLTQSDLAERLGSSQSRVAKMEAGDRSVSLDLLTRGLIALGATRADLARILRSSTGKKRGGQRAS